MENINDYIRPELLVLVPVLYVIGIVIKDTDFINDKYIPVILGVLGIVLSTLYTVASGGMDLMGVFTAITQGVLVTGAAVYVNQLIKQLRDK